MPDPNEFVRMTHPSIDTVSGQVTREAFEDVYKDKGWKLATADETAAADASETPVEKGAKPPTSTSVPAK